MSLESRAARALNALGTSWSILAEVNDGETTEIDGSAAFVTGGARAACNQALVNRAPPVPRTTIDRLIAFFDRHQAAFTIQVIQGLDAVEQAAVDSGLRLQFREPFMIVEAGAVSAESPPGVTIEPVDDDRSIAANLQASAAGFGALADDFRVFMNARLTRRRDFAAFNAVLDGEVVGTATMLAAAGVAGIFAVTTAEAARGRGIGAAVTAAAVRAGAQRGCDLAYLQSSEMGYRVYERLGFRTVTNHSIFRR